MTSIVSGVAWYIKYKILCFLGIMRRPVKCNGVTVVPTIEFRILHLGSQGQCNGMSCCLRFKIEKFVHFVLLTNILPY